MQTLFHQGSAGESTCRCPRCGRYLPSADINVGADTALCRACGSTYKFSELVASGNLLTFDPTHPPDGVSYAEDWGGTRISASTRSYEAFLLVPFMCVWSGFSLTGIYGSQIHRGTFSLGSSLFGIPFLLGSLYFGGYAAMRACGCVRVMWKGDECAVFTAAGPVGWTRRFRWSQVQSVREDDAAYGPRGGPKYRLIRIEVLEGTHLRSIKFGTLLASERRQFVLSALLSRKGKQ